MSRIMTKPEPNERLMDYYRKAYGQKDTAPWYDTTVANVKIFARDGALIPLKYHIGLCRHKAAVALAPLLPEKDAGYDFKTDFVALNRETFWQLASTVEEIAL